MNKPTGAASIERLIPDQLDQSDVTGAETYRLHVERYEFAARHVEGKRVLDCACGVGYGSAILAEAGAASVLGVDIDGEAVGYAVSHYKRPNLEFLNQDGTKIEGRRFDVIVSLETVEHVPDPASLIANFVRLLEPGGTLIASVPVTPSKDVNPYHLHDFTPGSFRKLLGAAGLDEVAALPQCQPFSPLRMARGQEKRLADMRQNLVGYYATHPLAALKRLTSTLVDGFNNKYLTLVCTRRADGRTA